MFRHQWLHSGTLQCNSAGQVTGTLYTDGGCGIVVPTGSGTGNGAMCITLSMGARAEAGSKINCGSGSSGGGGGGASSWVGTYRAGSQYNQAICCCLTGDITVSESGSDALVSGGVTGQCGSSTRTTIVVQPYLTSNSFTSTLPGGDHATFTLSSDGNTITEVDSSSPQCGGTATRVSNGASIGSAVDAKIILAIVVVSMLALLHA